MSTRSERINTRALLNGDPGDANYTDPKVRMTERARVLGYWPDDLIVPVRDGHVSPPPWRLLLDPTAWQDVRAWEVHEYVRGFLAHEKRWPSIDGIRRRFGRVSNHRSGGEVPEQESLLA